MMNKSWIAPFVMLTLISCSCNKGGDNSPVPPPPTDTTETFVTRPSVAGIRVAWDYSTLKRISPLTPGTRNYCGYGRLIQLSDQSLLCVYEADGNIESVRSTDAGNTWSGIATIAVRETGINMAVPEILQLADNSLLVSYNPRPVNGNTDPSKKYSIKTKKSSDNGLTWNNERTVYEGDYRAANGCWEPAQLQLPSGEIQLFFSNETNFTSSNEQEIVLVRSSDGGLTWGVPNTVAYRAGRRDGMPVPVLLSNINQIVFSIEDNNVSTFKPYTIRSSVSDNWNTGVVTGNSPNRNYSLAEALPDAVYAGAPYLRQLKTNQTILSYQSTEGRTSNDLGVSRLIMAIGDETAKNFNRKSEPFQIDGSRSGLWNSVSVLNDNTVVAVTSTTQYSNAGTEVWMIKGHVIPEQEIGTAAIAVDGIINEVAWNNNLPVFVGHKGVANVKCGFAYSSNYLYAAAMVKDASIKTDSPIPEDDDAFFISIDAKNKSAEGLAKSIYRITVSADNKLSVKEGFRGNWVNYTGNTGGIEKNMTRVPGGYNVEMAIPWTLLGGQPALNTRIGFNVGLINDDNGGAAEYSETITSNIETKPFTWMTMKLR